MLLERFFNLKPGMMVELSVLSDGKLTYAYDGPIPRACGDRLWFFPRQIGPDGRPIGNALDWQTRPLKPIPTRGSTEEDLRDRIVREFKRDPEVISLIEQIKMLSELLGDRRNSKDPTSLAARKRLDTMTKDYNNLWKIKSQEIRRRLRDKQIAPAPTDP